jgi:superfamily II DNA helicase RecQ
MIQITGTRNSKSLSFILPTYCILGRVTIVIALLVSLKDDLQKKYKELQIDSII